MLLFTLCLMFEGPLDFLATLPQGDTGVAGVWAVACKHSARPASFDVRIDRTDPAVDWALRLAAEKFADNLRRELAHWDSVFLQDILANSTEVLVKQAKLWAAYADDRLYIVEGNRRLHSLELFVSRKKRRAIFLEVLEEFSSRASHEFHCGETLAETVRSRLTALISVRQLSQFQLISECVPSTREWVREHVIWTGCPPPRNGSDRTISVPLLGVSNCAHPSFRPAYHAGAKAWTHSRAASRRRLQYRDDGGPTLRASRMARSYIHVPRRTCPRRWRDLEGPRRRPLVVAVRVDRRIWGRQCSP